ncbi:MAG: hypothetical protein P1U42_07655 [Phycisphaerales bacterium]|nr:hypothetical protein [Phycisphaerales bacterium]
MSKKWQRNKAWENENLVGPLMPIRLILRIFSSIPTAIVLLLFVSLYATLASIPIGMIAKIPTVIIDLFTLVGLIAITVLPAMFVIRKSMSSSAPGARFIALFATIVIVGGLTSVFWTFIIWPKLQYNIDTGTGFRLFPEFVEQYKSTTIRRLPGFEMTETQFYAWWPMRLALVLFVMNLIVATIRRIEFTFKNSGVLMVHTGIVTIALGSVFYQRFKLEGDTLLPAGTNSLPGPAQKSFYDRQDVALFVAQARTPNAQPRFEQRPLNRLPLYNAYSLTAGLPEEAKIYSSVFGHDIELNDEGRTLDMKVPDGSGKLIDADIQFRVVGFSPYAELEDDWYQTNATSNDQLNPFRLIELYYTKQAIPGQRPTNKPIFQFPFFLGEPAHRIRSNDLMAIEYTQGMNEQRWKDLSIQLPVQFEHALVIDIPELGFHSTLPVHVGDRLTLGDTGWTLAVDQLSPEPPFPIITPGYEDATSSVAIIKLTPPVADDGTQASTFDRWVFHRFPELNQDLTPTSSGRPARSDPDPTIRVSYIDASKLQIYIDENQTGDQVNSKAIIRQPTGEVRVLSTLDEDWLDDVIPNEQGDALDLHVVDRWENARKVKRPVPTPARMQDKSLIGSYANAFVAIEVSLPATEQYLGWSKVIWIPFAQYYTLQTDRHTKITLPDGRNILLVFGRYQRRLPGFEISLIDFEMIAYDHRGAPRDYQSIVRVSPDPFWAGPKLDFTSYEHVVKLNAPLRAPHHWDEEKSWISNSIRRLAAGMNPKQFKLSQSGWDRSGWEQSQEMVDRGMLDVPRANWTILGVGNNPGIHIIAFGSILMSIGIPWAFYFKPYLVKREKARLALLHADSSKKKSNNSATQKDIS